MMRGGRLSASIHHQSASSSLSAAISHHRCAVAQQHRHYGAKLTHGGPAPGGPNAKAANVIMGPGGLTGHGAPSQLRSGVRIDLDAEELSSCGGNGDYVHTNLKMRASNHSNVSSFSVFAAPIPSADLRPISDVADPIHLFAMEVAAPAAAASSSSSSLLNFSVQLPHTPTISNGPTTLDLLVTSSCSPQRVKVALPIETLLDNDALTFDNNVQRHSIVSPSLIDAAQCSIKSVGEIAVEDSGAPFAERLEKAIRAQQMGPINNNNTNAQQQKKTSGSNSHKSAAHKTQRYLLITWNSNNAAKAAEAEAGESALQQPSLSPYVILADPQGTPVKGLNGACVSAVPVSALEAIARIVADSVSDVNAQAAAEGAGNTEKVAEAEAKESAMIADKCFDAFSDVGFGGTLSPHFYRNMRVLPQYANVLSPNAVSPQPQQQQKGDEKKMTMSPPSSSSSASSVVIPRTVPLDRLYWDHAMMYPSKDGGKEKTLLSSECFATESLLGQIGTGRSAATASSSSSSSHESLRATMKRRDGPAAATVVTNSLAEDTTQFQRDARKLIMTIENFGFGILEDADALGGFPPIEGASAKPLVYVAPAKKELAAGGGGDATIVNSNTRIVDYRAATAEKLITRVFGYVRNCHYGLFSTWSNGAVWKHEDLSDDAALMAQLDAFNAKHGHKTQNLRSASKGGKKGGNSNKKATSASPAAEGGEGDLHILNKSGSDPHADGAYSGIHLDLHTDNTYFVDVPRLQAFGCIFTHTSRTTGGESSLVDGARVALEAARLCSPNHAPATVASQRLTAKYSVAQRRRFLELLCTVPIAGRFEKEEHYYNGIKPIINLTKGATVADLMDLAKVIPASTSQSEGEGKEVVSNAYVEWCRKLQSAVGGGGARPLFDSISFNNSDRAPLNPFVSKAFRSTNTNAATPTNVLDLVNPAAVKEYYQAYEWFHTLVHDPQLAIHFTLRPGQMLFFDNHRVLHGRLEFNGPRVMCGSYVANDEYYSSLKAACNAVNNKQ